MREESYHELHALEQHHWWYVGARYVFRTLLKIGVGMPQGNQRMLEIGCGSGGNLALLGEYGPTVGVEISPLALNFVEKRPGLGLVQADATALPFAGQSFDAVNLFSVIEHIEDDETALAEARRVCRPAGAVALLTSAVPFLWSHHDEANLHRRRYMPDVLAARLRKANLSPLMLSYQNFFAFFPTALVRLWQKRQPKPARYDMGNPPELINRLLVWLVRLEAFLMFYLRLPIGVDLVAVARPDPDRAGE